MNDLTSQTDCHHCWAVREPANDWSARNRRVGSAFSIVAITLGLLGGCSKTPSTATAVEDATNDGSSTPDTKAHDIVVAEVDGLSTDAADTGPKVADCPGGARCPCSVATDCESGLCVDAMSGRFCAGLCSGGAGCAATETCTTVTLPGGGVQSVCAPRWASLCAPCSNDADCAFPGSGTQEQCVGMGAAGRFCTAGCATSVDCPDGYACSQGSCRPTAGVCACTAWAAIHKTVTACAIPGASGACKSTLTCAVVGPMPACLAASPTAETCNGQDDNCNGLIDEGANPSCDDENPCTQDVCKQGSCQHVKNVVCGDGDCADGCGESATLCPIDCHTCGNGVCETGEGPKSCAVDCCGVAGKPAACGDGVCAGYECGESATNCQQDCTAPCGNKICEAGESAAACPTDCQKEVCGNGICEPGDGGPATCPKDCDSSCGNCLCEGGENATNCPNDCGHCGDGVCSVCAGLAENATSCPGDCSDLKLVGCTAAWQLFCKDGQVCTTDDCVSGKGCVHLPSDGSCTDGNVCTQGDACANGGCVPGIAIKCDDSNPCTLDGCDPIVGCTKSNADGLPCSDNDPCTLGDACLSGTCASGGPPNCDDANPCTKDSCGGGKCLHLPNAATCTDANACTVGEHCVGGGCFGSSSVKCDDGKACTLDSCDPTNGCTATDADGLTCNDGNPCTFGDACVGGLCQSGSPPDCDDQNICTDDSCASGKCVHAANDSACTDNNACTVGESCSGGVCTGATAVVCNDGNNCTADSCELAVGCTASSVDGVGCDDGDGCTAGDLCADATCTSGAPRNCDDGNVCTADNCANGACSSLATTGKCNDSNPCTNSDACTAGTCAGTAISCDDGNTCTVDSCDGVTGKCVHGPQFNGAPCSGGNACTSGLACLAGVCTTGTPLNCNDNNACTDDSCSPASGACVHAFNTATCDDGGTCTVNDVCSGGTCTPGQLKAGFADATCNTCTDGFLLINTNVGNVCAADQPVWGVRPLSPGAFFSDNGDGTISDSQTGLMWQKADNGADVTWLTVYDYCHNLALAGHNGWRWPTYAELETLIDYTVPAPAVPTIWKPVTASDGYWTAVGDGGYAWAIGLGTGDVGRYGLPQTGYNFNYRGRCVR